MKQNGKVLGPDIAELLIQGRPIVVGKPEKYHTSKPGYLLSSSNVIVVVV